MTSEVGDRLAVKDLIDRYSDSVNRRDFGAMALLFADDAAWEVGEPFNLRLEGPAIAQGLGAALANYALILQGVAGSVIEIDGSRAHARSTIYEMGKNEDGDFVQFGIYEDVAERREGSWQFTSRRFHPLYRSDTELAGQVFPFSLAR